MPKKKKHTPHTQSSVLVFVQNGERWLAVNYEGTKLRIQDTQPELERPIAAILDSYCAQYQEQLQPYLQELAKLRSLALSYRRSTPGPNLPL